MDLKFKVTPEDFVQPKSLWKALGRTSGQQENLICNIASHLRDADPGVRTKTYEAFMKMVKELGHD